MHLASSASSGINLKSHFIVSFLLASRLPTSNLQSNLIPRGPNVPNPARAPASTKIVVQALRFVTNTAIRASEGQKFTIKANGTVNLATEGPYIVDANGTIIKAPANGSGAQGWFKSLAAPIGDLPAVGAKKIMIAPNVTYLQYAPYGALVAGFSQIPDPKALTDFPSGFVLVGSSGIVVAPSGGGYLFLAVNDYYSSDNDGSFDVDITPAKEN